MAPSPCPRHAIEPGYSFARIINGCWQLSEGHGGNQLGRKELMQRFSELVDAGFTTFDCADIYTGVEEKIGQFLSVYPHSESVQVHTKYVPDLDSLAQLQARDTERIIHRSLRRLGRERLDLVQFHWWDYQVPGYLEAFGTLERLREEGKIAHLGVTNFDVPRLRELLDAGMKVRTVQAQFSLLDRRVQKGMQELCLAHDVSILAYGVLAGGMLVSGQRDVAGTQENRSLTKYRLVLDEIGGAEILDKLRSAVSIVADRHGCSVSMVAAAWVLQQAGVGAAILGVGNHSHIDENLAVSELVLDQRDRDIIQQVLERAGTPAGDVFELERQPGGRHRAKMKMNLNTPGNAQVAE